MVFQPSVVLHTSALSGDLVLGDAPALSSALVFIGDLTLVVAPALSSALSLGGTPALSAGRNQHHIDRQKINRSCRCPGADICKII